MNRRQDIFRKWNRVLVASLNSFKLVCVKTDALRTFPFILFRKSWGSTEKSVFFWVRVWELSHGLLRLLTFKRWTESNFLLRSFQNFVILNSLSLKTGNKLHKEYYYMYDEQFVHRSQTGPGNKYQIIVVWSKIVQEIWHDLFKFHYLKFLKIRKNC